LRRDRLAIAAAGLCLAAALFPVAAVAQDEPYDGRPYLEGGALRLQVTPKDAAVYVDGFYAGIVDDFNSAFQRLPVPPGEHELVLHSPGFRTVHQRINVAPRATYKARLVMEKLGPGETAEPPPVAPSAPPPEEPPPPIDERARPAGPGEAPAPMRQDGAFGTLAIRVQPADAEIWIDGERWSGSDGGVALRVEVAEGRHRVEIQKDGFRRFATEVDVRRGETVPVNVSLSSEREQ
jgi:hypothetical protein